MTLFGPFRDFLRRHYPALGFGSHKAPLNLLTADIKTLQQMLTAGTITSASLVDAYLAQIHKHDGYLHAMIQTTPLKILKDAAKTLDDERGAGKVRGPLHGIPVIVKVCIRVCGYGYEHGYEYRLNKNCLG
jgi:Asp-tRNA(Asn)/Glu-tRNA(Gln) amidotransferase A subunit family amidase